MPPDPDCASSLLIVSTRMWRDTIRFVTPPLNDAPYFSLFCLHMPTTIPNMALHRHHSPRCHSTGRVTAKLLLSFLALSPSTVASASYQQQHQPIPILPPFPGRPEPQTPSNNEHVFVSLNKIRVPYKLTYCAVVITACVPPWS